MVQPGPASTGGVSFGFGSVLTLTPQDAEEIVRQCPAIEEVAPTVRARSQVIYGSRNWVPMEISGTTPSYLAVRDWEEMDEGQMFTDRDVRNQSKVCVIGQTLKRQLFDEESPVGREIRIQNIAFRVIGVLSRKGANMMGMDQDDVVLAPWTTIKYRVSATSLANVNQSASSSSARGVVSPDQVNTLSKLYPGSTPLYSTPSASQQANTPQPVRFVNVDRIMAKATSTEEIPQAMDQITELLRERHRIRSGQPDDFNIRDMSEITRTLSSTSQLMSALLLVVALISLVVGGVGS
jgi:ABC-type antimicrobial peptide transport system permease subunit